MDPNVLTVYKSPFNKTRIGKNNDGGYVIVELPNLQYSMLLGCGIDNDISFEQAFVNKYNVPCNAYDGTISNLPSEHQLITFVKKNINPFNNDYNTNLNDIIDTTNNLFLKMDIEGSEIGWIKSLTVEQLDKFEQIVIEFHSPFSSYQIDVFDKLNQVFYLVHFHPNNCCGVRLHRNVIIPNVFECTYLNKRHFTTIPELNNESIPTSIDMPNTSNNDIFITHPPFVN